MAPPMLCPSRGTGRRPWWPVARLTNEARAATAWAMRGERARGPGPRSTGAFDARLRGGRRAGEHEVPEPEGEAEQPGDLCQRHGPHVGPGEQRDPEGHREQPAEAEQGTLAGGLPRHEGHAQL